MSGAVVRELVGGRQMIDLGFRDTEGLVASYLLPGPDGWSLVETGPASCRESLLKGLERAGVGPREIRSVFVTHIHLDHAGGVGALAESLPDATFYAHVRGVPHLIDPTKLVTSARRAWGAASDAMWGPVVPVKSGRLVPLYGGERFSLDGGELIVLETPGHASHHLSFWDTCTRSLLTGDSCGVLLQNGWRPRPALPPPDLDLGALFRSLTLMRALEPATILYSHFGPGPSGARELDVYRTAVEDWRGVALSAAQQNPNVDFVARRLREFEEAEAEKVGIRARREDRTSMISSYDLAAQGLLRYFAKTGLISEGAR